MADTNNPYGRGHYTESASTSTPAAARGPLDLMVEAGDWSSAKVFEKHYHKRPDRTASVQAVLDTFCFFFTYNKCDLLLLLLGI